MGGSRSGKSAFAERLAGGPGAGRVVYIATADACDPEMYSRIAAHRSRRPAEWRTWEGDVRELPGEMRDIARSCDTLLLDSLATYLSGALRFVSEETYGDESAWPSVEREILNGTREIFTSFRESADGRKRLIVVSDEVGCGLIPPYVMGRRFRDALGSANQIAAGAADEVVLVVAGIPIWIKGGGLTA
jgi:adenosylcobinamide kinase/adenosylcobinamide-phosphate guanylyltransferase